MYETNKKDFVITCCFTKPCPFSNQPNKIVERECQIKSLRVGTRKANKITYNSKLILKIIFNFPDLRSKSKYKLLNNKMCFCLI